MILHLKILFIKFGVVWIILIVSANFEVVVEPTVTIFVTVIEITIFTIYLHLIISVGFIIIITITVKHFYLNGWYSYSLIIMAKKIKHIPS